MSPLESRAQKIMSELAMRGYRVRRLILNMGYNVELPGGDYSWRFNIQEFVRWGQQELQRVAGVQVEPTDLAQGEPSFTGRNNNSSDAQHLGDQSEQASIAELRTTLAAREKTIGELREKGKRVVADRDRWEALAKGYEKEIADLKARLRADQPQGTNGDQFRQLKNALARMFHPDALRSTSNFERVVREELYKEITAKIRCIERKLQST